MTRYWPRLSPEQGPILGYEIEKVIGCGGVALLFVGLFCFFFKNKYFPIKNKTIAVAAADAAAADDDDDDEQDDDDDEQDDDDDEQDDDDDEQDDDRDILKITFFFF